MISVAFRHVQTWSRYFKRFFRVNESGGRKFWIEDPFTAADAAKNLKSSWKFSCDHILKRMFHERTYPRFGSLSGASSLDCHRVLFKYYSQMWRSASMRVDSMHRSRQRRSIETSSAPSQFCELGSSSDFLCTFSTLSYLAFPSCTDGIALKNFSDTHGCVHGTSACTARVLARCYFWIASIFAGRMNMTKGLDESRYGNNWEPLFCGLEENFPRAVASLRERASLEIPVNYWYCNYSFSSMSSNGKQRENGWPRNGEID